MVEEEIRVALIEIIREGSLKLEKEEIILVLKDAVSQNHLKYQ
jgi:hypothetical protein